MLTNDRVAIIGAGALVTLEPSGMPAARVIGTGTLLDSNRLQRAVAEPLGIVSGVCRAMVLGEHGDSSVAALPCVSAACHCRISRRTATRPGSRADLREALGTLADRL